MICNSNFMFKPTKGNKMHFTNDEALDIANQGIADIFNGTESYAQRFMQGMLFANDAVSFKDVNGTEGLLSDVASKISQFVKWLWAKLKSVFGWLFGGGEPQYVVVVKEGRAVIDEYAKEYTLRSDADTKMHSKLTELIKRFKEGTDSYVKHLKDVEAAREKSKLTNIGGASISEFEKKFEQYIEFFEKRAETVRTATNVKIWGYAVLEFIDHMGEAQTWFSKHYVCHNATRVKGGTTQSQIDEAIQKDIAKLPEAEQKDASVLIVQLANFAVNTANYLNVNINSCNTIISSIKSKAYFNKK